MAETAAMGPITMQPPADKIWSAAQLELRTMLSADTYNLWFAPLRAHALENDNLVLEVANDTAAQRFVAADPYFKDAHLGFTIRAFKSSKEK